MVKKRFKCPQKKNKKDLRVCVLLRRSKKSKEDPEMS